MYIAYEHVSRETLTVQYRDDRSLSAKLLYTFSSGLPILGICCLFIAMICNVHFFVNTNYNYYAQGIIHCH